MENYKEEQKKYRDMYKNRGKIFWVSIDKSNPIVKGRTYINPNKKTKADKK